MIQQRVIPIEALDAVRNRETLFAFLRDQLGWPVDPEDTFTYQGPSVPGETAARVEVRRLVPFSAQDHFVIMLAEFQTDFRRTDLREILRAIRKEMRTRAAYQGKGLEEVIFLCATRGYQGLRFAHFREQEGRQPKLSVFGWERENIAATRTLREVNLPALHLSADLFGAPDWSGETRRAWVSAWDVEAVTARFFIEFHDTFADVKRCISAVSPTLAGHDLHTFTLTLMNRLLFCWFIQQKKWLAHDPAFLTRFWEQLHIDHRKTTDTRGDAFYADYLRPLFLKVLNVPQEAREPAIKALIGEERGDCMIPYLNGGLFEENALDRRADPADPARAITVPNAAIELLISAGNRVQTTPGLFQRWNFTVQESTPLDIDVAVDPEMLGKVFEELITARHETGAYYTPRQVVSFMCREALKAYLGGEYAALVDDHDAGSVTIPQAKALLARLADVRAVDPACGSGAYLLGMLHELHALNRLLDTRAERLTARDDHDRKFAIIRDCLYGVDIEPFAVEMARLRLWLSLAVEFEDGGNLASIPPLPNLDFKIECGDSLLAPNPQGGQQPDLFRQDDIEIFRTLKAEHAACADPAEKNELKSRIDALRAKISVWAHPGKTVSGFDWGVEFIEVFQRGQQSGGFDIVIANPPYVRADAQFRYIEDENERQKEIAKWQAYRKGLVESKVYTTLYEKWDLYIPFLERAYQLLRQDGFMTFIIPDSYNSAKYTIRSHRLFLENTRIERIDFCSDIPLFTAGVANTIVHFVKTKPTDNDTPIRVRRWGENAEDFDNTAEYLTVKTQEILGQKVFSPVEAQVFNTEREVVPLRNLCYISYGLRANSDERFWRGEFVTNDVVSDTKDRIHPKRFTEGKDVIAWAIKRTRYIEWGTERAPGRFARPTFIELHEADEKLISLVVAAGGPPVAYDSDKHFTTHTSCIFVQWWRLQNIRNKSIRKTAKYRDEVKPGEGVEVTRDQLEERSRSFSLKYLLAIMNSDFAANCLVGVRRNKIHAYPDDWKNFPIAVATAEEQMPFIMAVDEILALYSQHGLPLPSDAAKRLAELEAEINERVTQLYKV